MTKGDEKKSAGSPAVFKRKLDGFLAPLLKLFVRLSVKPNALTLFGVVLSIPAAFCLVHRQWAAAAGWILASGIFDVLDGALARWSRASGVFGAFFDSTMDRISEAVVFLGFILVYTGMGDLTGAGLAFTVCFLSLLISYTRARAEGLGMENDRGWATRPVRVLLLAAGLLAGQPKAVLWILAVLCLATVFQRIYHVFKTAERVLKSKRK